MRTINQAHSELTGCLETATICPKLISDCLHEVRTVETDDGHAKRVKVPAVICDGIPDIDLLMMHEFGYDENGVPMPIELVSESRDLDTYAGRHTPRTLREGCTKMAPNVPILKLRAAMKKTRANKQTDRREELLKEHEKRIQSQQHRWSQPSTDEDVEEFIQSVGTPKGLAILAKLMG